MVKLAGNLQLTDSRGRPLFTLREINSLEAKEKENIYRSIIPGSLFKRFGISEDSFLTACGKRAVRFIAPSGLGVVRIHVRINPSDQDDVFFLEIADTHYHQMELSLCVINDPSSPRFDVDVDEQGRCNFFSTSGRNIPEELRSMEAGLYPNQTHRGMRMFGEFLGNFERFVDSLGMEFIIAEPLSYDNAIRYEKYGFDYISGKKMMQEINEGFRPGNTYERRLDGSTPFRRPGFEKTVRGRSWAIHDGILNVPWDGIRIYFQVGKRAGVDTFPERETEPELPA